MKCKRLKRFRSDARSLSTELALALFFVHHFRMLMRTQFAFSSDIVQRVTTYTFALTFWMSFNYKKKRIFKISDFIFAFHILLAPLHIFLRLVLLSLSLWPLIRFFIVCATTNITRNWAASGTVPLSYKRYAVFKSRNMLFILKFAGQKAVCRASHPTGWPLLSVENNENDQRQHLIRNELTRINETN